MPARRGFDTTLGYFLRGINQYDHCALPKGNSASKCQTVEGPEGVETGAAKIYDFFLGADGVDVPVQVWSPQIGKTRGI